MQVTLPEDLSGTQYIFVQTGGPYQFIYTSGNQGRSDAVQVTYVPPPAVDLDVLGVTGPTTALDSSAALVTWTVANNGPQNASGTWTDSVYLALNGNFSQAVDLGDFQYTTGLQAGTSYTRTEQVTLPSTAGVYEFFVMADSGKALADTNFANNLLASAPLIITLRPRPDLEVTSLTVPQSVAEGGVINVQWQVTNLGQAATPTGQSQWTDSVYLSLDNKLDSSDILLGNLPNGKLRWASDRVIRRAINSRFRKTSWAMSTSSSKRIRKIRSARARCIATIRRSPPWRLVHRPSCRPIW